MSGGPVAAHPRTTMMGRLLHYAADALMVSTILAGIKQTSGITPDITQVSEPNVRQAVYYYLSAGRWYKSRATT